MKKYLASAIALTAVTATPVMANDFTGPRVEVQIAMDSVSTLESDKYSDDDETYYDRDTASAFAFGFGAGYDLALKDKLIAGVEANLNFSNAEDGGFEGYIADYVQADEMRVSRDIDVSARLGYTVSPNVLIYAKAGYAVSRLKFDIYEEYYADDYFDERWLGRQARNRGGLRVGAGVEAKIASGVYTKFEYRYTDYNDWKSTNDYTQAHGYSNDAEFKINRHQAVAAIGYRF